MTDMLYNTQGIENFQVETYLMEEGNLIYLLTRDSFSCPCCGSKNITITKLRRRLVRGVPMGIIKVVYFEFDIHRIYCKDCKNRKLENIPFLSHPTARVTKALESEVLNMRLGADIKHTAKYFKLDWHTVKAIEKEYLKNKFDNLSFKNVKFIGIDEPHVGSGKGSEQFLTIVRDLESKAVIHVGVGKGVSALDGVYEKLKDCNIKAITMDMANAYHSWVTQYFPNADIVYDHFHLIKMMNEKLDNVRKRVTSVLDEEQRKIIKGLRFAFMRNKEDLSPDAQIVLNNMRNEFHELSEAYMFKETLRGIYREAKDEYDAGFAFGNWCNMANLTNVDELKTMARTITKRLKGLVTFWKYDGISNSHMEGFNNKLKLLSRKAFGFRDKEYFMLKIYQLPENSIQLQF